MSFGILGYAGTIRHMVCISTVGVMMLCQKQPDKFHSLKFQRSICIDTVLPSFFTRPRVSHYASILSITDLFLKKIQQDRIQEISRFYDIEMLH